MSTYVDPTGGSVAHCEAMAAQFPDLATNYYNPIAACCQEKLWHQLTVKVLEFLADPNHLRPLAVVEKDSNNTFVALYTEVVMVVSSKLNTLSLARMAWSVASASLKSSSQTFAECKRLLQDLLDKQREEDEGKLSSIASRVFLQSKIGLLELQHATEISKDALRDTYAIIKTNTPLLNQLMPNTPEAMVVNAAHYEMTMTYYELIGPPEAFFEEAIHYLNYYQRTADNAAQSHALAVNLCLAALTGDGVYNLGQVVTNPILHVLQNTGDAWLVDLLQACAKGNVTEFKTLVSQTYATQIANQPALVHMGRQVEEKVTLLALVEMVFERPSSERTLEFSDIAARLQISVDQVEWVLMRAFSVRLLEGTIDQVDGTAHITYVLPRSLSKEQMADLAVRFGEWAAKVGKAQSFMQEHATLAV